MPRRKRSRTTTLTAETATATITEAIARRRAGTDFVYGCPGVFLFFSAAQSPYDRAMIHSFIALLSPIVALAEEPRTLRRYDAVRSEKSESRVELAKVWNVHK